MKYPGIVEHNDMEPICGLPKELPEGEEILWQGRPNARSLARQAFKTRSLAVYFAVLVLLRVGLALFGGEPVEALGLFQMGALFGVCVGMLALVARLHARATVYTITNRRVVMRFGVALSMSWNLPFQRLAAADLLARSERDGDIVLRLTPPDRVSWMIFWPHVQPGRVLRASPTFRCVEEPAKVAAVLGDAVAAWSARANLEGASVPRREPHSEQAASESARERTTSAGPELAAAGAT